MVRRRFMDLWTVVQDEESALDAVKMAGLPVLVMGGNAFVAGLVLLVQPRAGFFAFLMATLIPLALIVVAFRLRGGHAGWVPVAAALFLLFLLGSALFLLWLFQLDALGQFSGIMVVCQFIIPAFCAVLALSGLKGWLWLSANKVRVTF